MPPEFRLVCVSSKAETFFYIQERYWSWWHIGWQYRRTKRSGYRNNLYNKAEAESKFKKMLTKVENDRSTALLTVVAASDETVKGNNYTLADCEPLEIMLTYNFEAMDATGQTIKDEIKAVSEDEAQALIRQMGYFVTKISRKRKT